MENKCRNPENNRVLRIDIKEKYNEILNKKGFLEHGDVSAFYRGLPKQARITAGVLFLYQLKGMTAREIEAFLLPDEEDLQRSTS